MRSLMPSRSSTGRIEVHISSSDLRESTGGWSPFALPPERKARYLTISVIGELSPPFAVVMPVSKSSPSAVVLPLSMPQLLERSLSRWYGVKSK